MLNEASIAKSRRAKRTFLIQQSAPHKTEKRDADALGSLLWNNRKRLQGEQRPHDIRRIFPADPADAQVRQLVNFRHHLVKQRTRIINKIKGIINKHNLSHDAPTENYATQKFKQWIKTVLLPFVDRLEINMNVEACHRSLFDATVRKLRLPLTLTAFQCTTI